MNTTAGSGSPQPFPSLNKGIHRVEPPTSPPKPNAHPYAIKTTSSAILTRSNSTTTPAHSAHYYVPTSTSPNSKHRYSRSDTDVSALSPRPLPVPPSPQSPTKANHHVFGTPRPLEDIQAPHWRTKRAETLPSIPAPSLDKTEDLPSNPKVWTTSQLSSYLTTALRVKSGDTLPLPAPVARDITHFVKDAGLTGRAFLRLTAADLEQMNINGLWRTALLNASHSLRQNVLKGQIWGFDDYNTFPNNKGPYPNGYHSSSSSIDLPGSSNTTPGKSTRRYRSGHVKGMVESLERSSSRSSSRSSTRGEEQETVTTTWTDSDGASSECDAEGPVHKAGLSSSDEFVFGSPISTDSDPPLEPVTPASSEEKLLPAIHVESNEDEPTVHDLLSSSKGSSDSWGAKAWVDIDLAEGVTVKRIVEPEQDYSGLDEGMAQSLSRKNAFKQGVSIGRSAGRKTSKSEARRRLGDLFSRPLPEPPQESPADDMDTSSMLTEGSSEVSKAISPFEELPSGVEVAGTSVVDAYEARIWSLEAQIKDMTVKESEGTKEYKTQFVQTDTPVYTVSSQAVDTEDLELEPLQVKLPESKTYVSTATETLTEETQSPVDNEKRELAHRDHWDPLDGRGLTSYVLMVGIGVCAIVLQTMLKRLATRRP